MFRKLMLFPAVAGIAALSMGAAATLNLSSEALGFQPVNQAGSSDLVCDEDGVQVRMQDDWINGQWQKADATIGGISNDCAGHTIKLVLLDSNGNVCGYTDDATINPDGSITPSHPEIKGECPAEEAITLSVVIHH